MMCSSLAGHTIALTVQLPLGVETVHPRQCKAHQKLAFLQDRVLDTTVPYVGRAMGRVPLASLVHISIPAPWQALPASASSPVTYRNFWESI